jgi:hypothetical protein
MDNDIVGIILKELKMECITKLNKNRNKNKKENYI